MELNEPLYISRVLIYLGGDFNIFFNFHPGAEGEDEPNLPQIFRMGW